MKRLSFQRLAAVAFLILFFGYSLYQVANKPRILVLHSYATDYDWVNEVSTGVHRILDRHPYAVRWHYMDTKRHPQEDFKKLAGGTAERLIDEWQPDVVIAIDDNAQKYVASHYLIPTSSKPFLPRIVYAGMGAEPEAYGYDSATNVTGILERMPLAAFKEVIIQLFADKLEQGQTIKLFHINDGSPSGLFNMDEINRFHWGPEIEIETVAVKTLDDWQANVRRQRHHADLMLLTNYHTLTNNSGKNRSTKDPCALDLANGAVPPKQVVQWTQCTFPAMVIGGWGFFVKDGGQLAVAVSGYEQGEVAAQMAIDIIDGKPINRIAQRRTEQFIIYLNGGLGSGSKPFPKYPEIPGLYEAFARAAGTYFE